MKLTPEYKYVCKNVFINFFTPIAIVLGMPFAYMAMKRRHRFEVEGRENIRALKKTSAVVVSNHVHDLDALMLTRPFFPKTPYVIALKHNMEMFLLGPIVRLIRGTPLPDPTDRACFSKFRDDVNELLRTTTHKVTVFPEASIEPYCRQLRNFRKGAFYFSVHNNKPLLPCVFVFPDEHRVKMLIAPAIYPKDLPGFGEVSEPKLIAELANQTRHVMEGMLDDYYARLDEQRALTLAE